MPGTKRLKKKVVTIVSIANAHDLDYWCNRLRVSPALLTQTIAVAGLGLSDIENALILGQA